MNEIVDINDGSGNEFVYNEATLPPSNDESLEASGIDDVVSEEEMDVPKARKPKKPKGLEKRNMVRKEVAALRIQPLALTASTVTHKRDHSATDET